MNFKLWSLRAAALAAIVVSILVTVQTGNVLLGGAFLMLAMATFAQHAHTLCLGAETLVADLAIIPDSYLGYSVAVTSELSELITSGIIQDDALFSAQADIGFSADITSESRTGGQFVTLPFWNDLEGEDEVLSDVDSLSTGKMTTSKEMAVIHNRAKAWSHNDLVAIIGASDPATALGQRLGTYWSRRLQAMALATLKGVFAAPTMASHTKDVHLASGGGPPAAANFLSSDTFIDAKALLGDQKDSLTAVIMHSLTETNLEHTDDDLQIIIPSDGGGTIRRYKGLPVILDDTMTVEVINGFNVYSTFIFGRGALAYGTGSQNAPIYGATPGSTWGAEWARETLAGQNIFVNRRRFILHPRGVSFKNAAMAKLSPTNPELATASNWERVIDPKQVKMVRIRHNNPA